MSDNYSNLTLVVEDGLAIVAFNRPKALNALNAETIGQLDSVLTDVESNPEIRVLLLTGGGERAFVAGADIRELKECDAKTGQEASERGQKVFRRLEQSRLVVIAGVNGFALGGGMELSLACDFRIASESAVFGLPEVGLGIIPGYGGTQRLPRLIGRGLASELIFTGRKIDAKTALDIGLVNQVVPADQLLGTCRSIAREILHQAPLGLAAAKRSMTYGLETGLDEALKFEAKEFGGLCASTDVAEGMTAFLEKRPAVFTGK
jgi:enoyl-CoA hydratase